MSQSVTEIITGQRRLYLLGASFGDAYALARTYDECGEHDAAKRIRDVAEELSRKYFPPGQDR